MNVGSPELQPVDVLLLYPRTGVDLGATVAPPHALLTIAAPLQKAGYHVRIIDQRVDPLWKEHLVAAVKKGPICVGLSTMTGTQIYFALQMAKLVKDFAMKNIPLIWGGPHPSSLPEQTARHPLVDIVCIGEGDETFLDLVRTLQNEGSLSQVNGIAYQEGKGVVVTEPRPLLDVETLLPVPWDLVDVEKYIHRDFYLRDTIRSLDIGQTSRGCPFQCGFCSSASLRQRKWRAMSVEKSLSRILDPIKRFHLDSIWIRDDEFYIDRKRTYGICKGIVDSGIKIKWYTSGTRIDIFNRSTDDEIEMIKRSGADTLKFGAESGSNRILELMRKGIRWEDTVEANLKAKKHRINPAFALMIGFPTETFSEMEATINLFKRLKADNPQAQFEVIGTFTALPQTPLYSLALEQGLQPPQDLEGWIEWLSDEYDLKGRKIPWFNYAQRKKIGNITYMSILANSSLNAIRGINHPAGRFLLELFFRPISAFECYKLIHKKYHWAPELDLARFMRRKIFYRNPNRDVL